MTGTLAFCFLPLENIATITNENLNVVISPLVQLSFKWLNSPETDETVFLNS